MDKPPSAEVLNERSLAFLGYVVLIALFVLAPPSKTPTILVLSLLLAFVFLLLWAWPFARKSRLATTGAILGVAAALGALGWSAWPHPRLHRSDERLIQNISGPGTVGVYEAWTNEGDDAYWVPFGHAAVLPSSYLVSLTSQLYAACVREMEPTLHSRPDIPLNSEDGQGAYIWPTRVSADDYKEVQDGKEVLYFAGGAVAAADGVTRIFSVCGVVVRGAITRCAEEPPVYAPPTPACLSNPWASPAPASPLPLPAPNPN